MATKLVIIACLQAFALQGAVSQVILPQYQQLLPSTIIDTVPNCGCGCPPVLSLPPQVIQVPQQFVPTTVVQDSSVSNNLANALQLLVVSNLLSNTLPFNEAEFILPCGGVVEQVPYCSNYYNSFAPVVPSCGCGCGGYNVPSCGCGLPAPSCGCGPSCSCGGLNGLFGIF